MPLISAIAGLPPYALCITIPLIVPLLSNLGIHPIMLITFAGSMLSAAPELLVDRSILATAFIASWAVNLRCHHVNATNLVLSRTTGTTPTTMAWHWNGLFSLLAYLLCASGLCLLSWLLGSTSNMR